MGGVMEGSGRAGLRALSEPLRPRRVPGYA
jgi:hypothetical protein